MSSKTLAIDHMVNNGMFPNQGKKMKKRHIGFEGGGTGRSIFCHESDIPDKDGEFVTETWVSDNDKNFVIFLLSFPILEEIKKEKTNGK